MRVVFGSCFGCRCWGARGGAAELVGASVDRAAADARRDKCRAGPRARDAGMRRI
ncbi:hypothetical protein JYU34_009953 [Plutella xylostella]|uniref:Uncharacterized protein n=1 Tax=Plutella xylostella TaxID=51655 RepID=A0ABQ7QKQ5_PLUXY|nr:hypothetical protein JYU34_009953 [Plutella xylostella]